LSFFFLVGGVRLFSVLFCGFVVFLGFPPQLWLLSFDRRMVFAVRLVSDFPSLNEPPPACCLGPPMARLVFPLWEGLPAPSPPIDQPFFQSLHPR